MNVEGVKLCYCILNIIEFSIFLKVFLLELEIFFVVNKEGCGLGGNFGFDL